MSPVRVLIPLPDRDFDTTEASIPWRHFSAAGFEVDFSTENGSAAETDPLLLQGVIFGQLGAKPAAIAAYREMRRDPKYLSPLPYAEIQPERYDALLLPGGHAPGMKQYLESEILRDKVRALWAQPETLIGAICHGVIVLARCLHPETGESLIHRCRATALTKPLERSAYWLTAWKLGRYYRTYPEYVEEEVKRSLADRAQFDRGPSPWRPFAVEDGRLLTARYPLDAALLAERMVAALQRRGAGR